MQHENWDDVRVFLALQRCGTLAGAARRLCVNPTTVGRRLANLESRMDALLFHRTSDGLVPTQIGESMLEAAELMERQATLIADKARGGDAQLAGVVRIAVSAEFASYFLLDHLQAFRRRHPDIEIDLRASFALADLSRDEADLAIRFVSPGKNVPHAPAGPVEILTRKVGEVGVAVFAARSYLERHGRPAHADDVAEHDVIVPSAGLHHFPGHAWFARASELGRVALRVDDLAAVLAAGTAGFGLCALPTFMAARSPTLERVSPPYQIDSRIAWVLSPADLRSVARIRAMGDYIAEIFTTWSTILDDPNPRASAD